MVYVVDDTDDRSDDNYLRMMLKCWGFVKTKTFCRYMGVIKHFKIKKKI